MDDALSFKDIIYIIGIGISIGGSYFAIKYQGISNSKDIESVKASNNEQWTKIDEVKDEITMIKERITLAISMETAEKKFVTKEMFDLRMKQFDVDLKQTKGIAQNTLDAVQTLTHNVYSQRD